MKAATQTRDGPPEVVTIADTPRPTPKDDELLVEVHASTVTDCGFRAAHPWFVRFFSGRRRPRASVRGCEFAGVVEVVGSAVTSFAAGDRVFGYRDTTFGGHAEHMTIAEDGPVATMPANATLAAASTEGAHYALTYRNKGQVRAGQRVFVSGATGAIGSAAV